MTKNKIILLLVFISSICLISILFSLNNVVRMNEFKNENLSLKDSIGNNRFIDYFSQINDTIYFSELFYSNYSVRDHNFYWGNDSTKKNKLSSLLKNRKVLFFKYPRNACYSCIESIISMLDDSCPDYKNNNNIVFLSYDIEARFKENLHGKAGMTTLTPLITFEEYFLAEAPCFFIIDETMKIKYLHFYNKANEDRTRIYLNFISQYLKR